MDVAMVNDVRASLQCLFLHSLLTSFPAEGPGHDPFELTRAWAARRPNFSGGPQGKEKRGMGCQSEGEH